MQGIAITMGNSATDYTFQNKKCMGETKKATEIELEECNL